MDPLPREISVQVAAALAGPRWEVYGDWREDPAELDTTVSYLIRPGTTVT